MTRRPAAQRFDGAAVIITGASSGLGAALAVAFTEAGGNVVLAARNEDRLNEVAERCVEAGGQPLVIPADVTVPADCQALVGAAVERLGRLDVLVACAGLSMWGRFDELDDAEVLRRVMDVNYWGLVHPAHFALPHLKASGGVLVAISSVQGKLGVPYHSGYAASKHAVQGFCDSLRMELAGSGVEVLTVLAHWIRGTNLRQQALGSDGLPRGDRAAAHGSGAVPLEKITRRILNAIARRRRMIFIPRWMRLFTWLSELAPPLTDRLIRKRVNREATGTHRSA